MNHYQKTEQEINALKELLVADEVADMLRRKHPDLAEFQNIVSDKTVKIVQNLIREKEHHLRMLSMQD